MIAHRNVTLKLKMNEVEIRLDYLELKTLDFYGTTMLSTYNAMMICISIELFTVSWTEQHSTIPTSFIYARFLDNYSALWEVTDGWIDRDFATSELVEPFQLWRSH